MASEENTPPRQGSDPNDRIPMAQDALDLAQSRPNFIPNARYVYTYKKFFQFQLFLLFLFLSKLKQMGQSMSSLLGQLPSLSRTSTMNASPTTPLSPQTERMIQSIFYNVFLKSIYTYLNQTFFKVLKNPRNLKNSKVCYIRNFTKETQKFIKPSKRM